MGNEGSVLKETGRQADLLALTWKTLNRSPPSALPPPAPPVKPSMANLSPTDCALEEREAMAGEYRLLLEGAQQLVLVCTQGEKYLLEAGMQELAVLENASVVIGKDGYIKAVGEVRAIRKQFSGASFEKRIDCSGKCILPGLVDAHTHPVWAGDRVHEFAMKLAGASYMEIHQAGGGIHFTVEHTRKAGEEELFQSLKQRLLRMLRAGTTLVECKSGYGLNLEAEVKMLRVIERARRELDIGISSTYCGAHAVPKYNNISFYLVIANTEISVMCHAFNFLVNVFLGPT